MDMFIESLTPFFVQWGYWGLFIAALVAGSILPIGSEVVFALLISVGLDPLWCLLSATAGNTLGGMTCYWMGHLGKREWIHKYLKVDEAKLNRVSRFLQGRGALMGFFAFLPYIGEVVAIVLGLMRSNLWLTTAAMALGKFLRYLAILLAMNGISSLF
ncbi:MAG: YqaA family protein [Alistipes sp.]